MQLEFVPAKILMLEINVKTALQNITTLPMNVDLVNVTKVAQLTKIVMPMEYVLVKKILTVPNVKFLILAIMTLMIQKNVTATWKVLRMKLAMTKEDATVAVTLKETNAMNVIQNIGDSQHVMPVCVMNMVPWMISAMQLANAHVMIISLTTNVANVLKASLDIQIAKDVLAVQKDLKLPLATLLENVHAKPTLSELIVINVL